MCLGSKYRTSGGGPGCLGHITLSQMSGKNVTEETVVDMISSESGFALIFEVLDILPIVSYPIPSMYYGIFSYMYHKNRPNVGKCTIYIYIWMVCVL